MTFSDECNAPTFKQQERSGWVAKAKDYDQYAGEITRGAVQSLLMAAGVKVGDRLLDVASGPGYVAGAAAAQGAIAIGIDFASTMVVEAKRNFPHVEFREGDAENLQFEGDTFDVVTCAFGLLHLAEPNKAIAEAFRVLRSGGSYVSTVWDSRDKHEFFNLVLNAIETYGTLSELLPAAPSIFRFSDHAEFERTLLSTGFTEVEVTALPLIWEPDSPHDLLNFLEKSSVRMALLLELQSLHARERIYQAILEGANQFRRGNTYQIAWPAVMAVGRKPQVNSYAGSNLVQKSNLQK